MPLAGDAFYDPSLKDIPWRSAAIKSVATASSSPKNMLAKAKGVKTAEALWEAERKCPGIKFVPPHFERYAKYSRLAKEIYCSTPTAVESFGLDECWLDVTGSRRLFGSGRGLRRKFARASKMSSGSRCQSACRSTKFSQSSAATIKSRMP